MKIIAPKLLPVEDWDSYGYTYKHYFDHWHAIRFLVVALMLLGAVFWLAPHYLLDPSYHPVWGNPKCHGRRCGLGLIIAFCVYLFLLLPIWLKAPVSVFVSFEALVWLLTMFKFSTDKKPDFAIGPNGIYGLCRLHYYHVPWSKVGGIYLNRRVSLFPTGESLKIHTRVRCQRHWFWTRGMELPVRFLIPSLGGLPIALLIAQIKATEPDRQIRTIEVDTRPKWLR